MKKLFIISALAGFMFAGNSAHATGTTKPVASPAPAANKTSETAEPTVSDVAKCDVPKDFVDSLNKIVIDTVEDPNLSDADKTKALSDMFRNYVNIQWIGRFVLAQNWRSLKPEQQTEYLAAYEDYLLRTYVPIFKEYKGEKVEFVSATPLRNPAEFLVATRITRVSEPEIQISYRIKKDASCFKVYDMVAEGVSMLNTQRQDFSSIFARKGYNDLIKLLKSKVASPTPAKTK